MSAVMFSNHARLGEVLKKEKRKTKKEKKKKTIECCHAFEQGIGDVNRKQTVCMKSYYYRDCFQFSNVTRKKEMFEKESVLCKNCVLGFFFDFY